MPRASEATLQGEEYYVRREDLTREEVMENAARLRAEGKAELRHADALLAWAERRLRRELGLEESEQ